MGKQLVLYLVVAHFLSYMMRILYIRANKRIKISRQFGIWIHPDFESLHLKQNQKCYLIESYTIKHIHVCLKETKKSVKYKQESLKNWLVLMCWRPSEVHSLPIEIIVVFCQWQTNPNIKVLMMLKTKIPRGLRDFELDIYILLSLRLEMPIQTSQDYVIVEAF